MSARVENNIKYNQDHIIVLLLEHNFRPDAVVSRITLKSLMLKFSSIMYLTLAQMGFTRPMFQLSTFTRARVYVDGFITCSR